MSLYYKTLIIIGATLIGLVAILYFISQTILLNSFLELEQKNVQRNIERASTALLDHLVELNATAGDWAPWDETYTFIESQDEAYIQANLADSTLINLRLNFMLFFNNRGQLIFGKAFDLENQTEIDLSPALKDHFAKNDLLLRHDNPESSLTGVITMPDEVPLLVASRPIVTNDYQGPIRGSLVVGRYLDESQIKALGEKTRLDVTVFCFDTPSGLDDNLVIKSALLQGPPIIVQPLDKERVAGYTHVEDVYGQPGLILRITQRRDIYLQGQATFRYLIIALLGSGVLFGGVLLFLLNKGLVSRLVYLDKSVDDIAHRADLTARVSLPGRDEVSNLANRINTMLIALQGSKEALHQAYQVLETRVEERTAELSKSNRLLRIEIEERKRIEQALAQTRDQALAASRLKTELLARVSHELRTPLSVIGGYAEMLRTEMYGPTLDEQKRPLEHIIDNTRLLTQQVNELLDQARLETGKLELQPTNVVLRDLVDQIATQMQILAQAKGLSFAAHVAEALPVTIWGDPVRLHQILANLVGNAVKFTSEGSVQLHLYRVDQNNWAIKVIDTGPGIPAGARNDIFEPFRQLDGSITRSHSGAGLGLSIVKQLVTLMEGRIALESQVGQGSTFTVELPILSAPENCGDIPATPNTTHFP